LNSVAILAPESAAILSTISKITTFGASYTTLFVISVVGTFISFFVVKEKETNPIATTPNTCVNFFIINVFCLKMILFK
jgi:hypothetical protein